MTRAGAFGTRTLAALVCAALALWSIVPASSHVPKVFEVLAEHAEIAAVHGHSHGLEEDLLEALHGHGHGHGHEAADHDHSQALLPSGERTHASAVQAGLWRLRASPGGPGRLFRIERPPRA